MQFGPGGPWGTDLYRHDSTVCTAAVHAGRITREAGGPVTVEIVPVATIYSGSSRNGVTTSSSGWSPCGFVFP